MDIFQKKAYERNEKNFRNEILNSDILSAKSKDSISNEQRNSPKIRNNENSELDLEKDEENDSSSYQDFIFDGQILNSNPVFFSEKNKTISDIQSSKNQNSFLSINDGIVKNIKIKSL